MQDDDQNKAYKQDRAGKDMEKPTNVSLFHAMARMAMGDRLHPRKIKHGCPENPDTSHFNDASKRWLFFLERTGRFSG